MLSDELARHYASLSTRGKVLAEYVWVGGSGAGPCSSCTQDTELWWCDAAAGQIASPSRCSRGGWPVNAGSDLHSKSRVLDAKPRSVEELRPWHFDGSQTGQAPAASSAVYLRPRAIYPDPVRGAPPTRACCRPT